MNAPPLAVGLAALSAVLALTGLAILIRSVLRRDPELKRRLAWAAAPLAPFAGGGAAPEAESIFRTDASPSPLARGWERIGRWYPFVDARQGLPFALVAAAAGFATCQVALWFLQIPAGWWSGPLGAGCALGAGWKAIQTLQARRVREFVHRFPEVTDQVVRLAGAGVPPLEGIAIAAADAPPPVKQVLEEVRDGLLAGLDADTVLREASGRVRIAEFTLFAAVVRLQRRAGGGVTAALANISATLRERRAIAAKAHASTAQSRLTLVILVLMPPVVLVMQSFTNPTSVELLLGEEGTGMLRWGVALIVTGLLIVRSLGARAVR